MFTLINFIIVMLLTLMDHVLNISTWLEGLYTLALLLPGLAVEMRRLHDTGRSGWWIWITLVPIVDIIVLLVFLCQDSNLGDNKYGPNPKLRLSIENEHSVFCSHCGNKRDGDAKVCDKCGASIFGKAQ
jgi:uncharacterized membrane protein YhaH (DUF805 family)